MRCPECGQKDCCGALMSKEIEVLEEKCASMERITYDALAGELIAGISAERDALKEKVASLERQLVEALGLYARK